MSTTRHAGSLTEAFPALPDFVPPARRALVEFARAAGAEDEQVEALRLAASEAITNAVRHAYAGGPPGLVHVTAAVAEGELWVLVADDGHGLRAGSSSPGLGLGLALIASVSDYFSVVKRSTGGTELRMRFPTTAERTSSAMTVDQSRGRRSVVSARSAA